MTNPADSWPEMAETEYDDDNYAVPGTTPISVVSLGAWGRHNEPHPSVESAGCAYCNRWAVDLYAATREVSEGPLGKKVVRRTDATLIYVCDQHLDAAADELLDRYGYAYNDISLDLAAEVSRHRRMSNAPAPVSE